MDPQRWREQIEAEIERLCRRYGSLVREIPDAQEATARWTLVEGTLRWHVSLDEVVEPDLDLEILAEAIVVRARRQSGGASLILGVLAVPTGFDPSRPRIRFERGYLEIRLGPARGGQS